MQTPFRPAAPDRLAQDVRPVRRKPQRRLDLIVSRVELPASWASVPTASMHWSGPCPFVISSGGRKRRHPAVPAKRFYFSHPDGHAVLFSSLHHGAGIGRATLRRSRREEKPFAPLGSSRG